MATRTKSLIKAIIVLVVIAVSAAITKTISELIHLSDAINSDVIYIASFITLNVMVTMTLSCVVMHAIDDITNRNKQS